MGGGDAPTAACYSANWKDAPSQYCGQAFRKSNAVKNDHANQGVNLFAFHLSAVSLFFFPTFIIRFDDTAEPLAGISLIESFHYWRSVFMPTVPTQGVPPGPQNDPITNPDIFVATYSDFIWPLEGYERRDRISQWWKINGGINWVRPPPVKP